MNSLKNNFNTTYNNYESDKLNEEKLTPNQILFYKNIESLKNI